MCRDRRITRILLMAFAAGAAVLGIQPAVAAEAVPAAAVPTYADYANNTLTIGYLTPTFGSITLGVSPRAPLTAATFGGMGGGLSLAPTFDRGTEFTVPFAGAEFGLFSGYGSRQTVMALAPASAWTFGASVGYAGFYVRGGVSEAPSVGPLLGIQGLQAGFGYEIGALDMRVTFQSSQGIGAVESQLDNQQWAIGGIYRISSRLRLNADAFYGVGDPRASALAVAPPTGSPPGTGARVGVQLRF